MSCLGILLLEVMLRVVWRKCVLAFSLNAARACGSQCHHLHEHPEFKCQQWTRSEEVSSQFFHLFEHT
ncbi:hypothetical protein KC19_8G029300 [Ceratodon purpureus]|uniref:Secreted protein n=1 Tax=Ceratodon purpureus TaxID=3225 RepID=A0A8T0GY88_CERPU|nr:hypothetical protein KC19_8G029300 [Ceratodon purpureus]